MMLQDQNLPLDVAHPVPVVAAFVYAVVMGIGMGGLAGVATRSSKLWGLAPVLYVFTARLVSEGLSRGTGAPWSVRTAIVMVALVTMTGMMLALARVFAAEERYARRNAAEQAVVEAYSVPRWGIPVMAVLLLVVSGVTAAVVP